MFSVLVQARLAQWASAVCFSGRLTSVHSLILIVFCVILNSRFLDWLIDWLIIVNATLCRLLCVSEPNADRTTSTFNRREVWTWPIHMQKLRSNVSCYGGSKQTGGFATVGEYFMDQTWPDPTRPDIDRTLLSSCEYYNHNVTGSNVVESSSRDIARAGDVCVFETKATAPALER